MTDEQIKILREKFNSWSKDHQKKYLSFSPFDAFVAGYECAEKKSTENIYKELKTPANSFLDDNYLKMG